MSDGTPNDPTKRPMPWDAQPGDQGATPPEPSSVDSAPTEVTPTPEPPPVAETPPDAGAPGPLAPAPPTAEPSAAQQGLISAAPVGWGASEGSSTGAAPIVPPGSAEPGAPAVGWAAPPKTTEVPGAPGLAFADTVSRLVAYIVDLIIIGIVGAIVAGILGFGTTTVTETVDGTFSYYSGVSGAAFTIPVVILSLVYFVFFWTGGRRSTPGQRIFNIQVGNAFDGRALSIEQAVRRWLGYGLWLGLLALVPSLEGASSLVQLLWMIVLLITTITSPTKQGLHDRFANTALVKPSGQGASGLAMACLLLLALLIILPIIAIVALILLGTQVSTILSEIGESI